MSINLNQGDVIEYKVRNNDPLIEAVITGHATKRTSKAGKNWYNVTNIHTGKSIILNLDVLNVWNKIEGNFTSIQDHIQQLKTSKTYGLSRDLQ